MAGLANGGGFPKLGARAYEVLKGRIITCELMPGAVVDQNELMKEIGVSRTPVREAVNALEAEGLLVVMPRRGVIVAPISLSEVSQIYTVRENIEPLIVRLATPAAEKDRLAKYHRIFTKEKSDPDSVIRSDFEMHNYFAERTENVYLVRLMSSVLSQNMRIVVLGARVRDRLPASNREHAMILERMLDGDADGAVEAMRAHIASARAIASKVYKMEP